MLTEELVLQQAHVSSLSDVRRLSYRDVHYDNIAVLQHLCNVRVISMVNCGVATLQPFARCAALEELYLRRNVIANLREVTALNGLKGLHTLWLKDNPCATHAYYYAFALHCCQRLRHLDEVVVTHDLRRAAARRLAPHILDAILACDDDDNNTNNINNNNNGNNSNGNSNGSAAPLPLHDSSRHGDDVVAHSRQSSSSHHSDSTHNNEQHAPPPPAQPQHQQQAQPHVQPPALTTSLSSGGGGVGDVVAFTTQRAQRAMLMAIVSVLPELTIASLECVQDEVARLLQQQRALVATCCSNGDHSGSNSSGSGSGHAMATTAAAAMAAHARDTH